jgi:hypothetical protein
MLTTIVDIYPIIINGHLQGPYPVAEHKTYNSL